MEPEKIIETLKSRLDGESFDAFEICFLGEDRLAIEARGGEVESFSRACETGAALRVLKDHKLCWGSSSDLSPAALDKLVASVTAGVKEVFASEESVLPKPSRAKKEKSAEAVIAEKAGTPLADIPDAEKIAVALKLEREAKGADPRIVRVRQPLYEETVRRAVIYNSCGIMKSATRGMASCEVRAIAEQGSESESGYDFSFSPRFEDLDVEGTARRASERSVALLGAGTLPTGRYDVIFDPRPAAQLLRLAATSFFADNVQRGKSAIAEKKGKSVYSGLVTIIDDGLLPDGFGSFPFDDEGVARRKTILVKNGVVTNWLYDTQRGARDGKPSTGSSFRASVHKQAAIGVGNCYLAAGDTDQAGLLRSVKRGFFVTDVMGLHTANPVTGDFSLGAEGFVIEDYSKARPVRGVIVSGNIHELFARIAAAGAGLKFIGNYGSPAVLVPDVQVSGAG